MSTGILERFAMEKGKRRPGRPKGERDDVSVKIDRRIAEMGKLLAAHRNCTLAELASDLLKGPIERGYAAMLRELEQGDVSER